MKKKAKIFRLLSNLGTWELKAFQSYLESPYFNTHKRIIKLFHLIKIFHPDYPEKNCSKHSLFVKLFEGPYREQVMSDLFSYLCKHLEDFLALEYWKNDSFQQQYALVQHLRDRGLQVDYGQQLKVLGKKLPPRPVPEQYHQFYTFEAAQLQLEHGQQKRGREKSFPAMVQALDDYYLLNRLRYGCALINRRDVVAAEANLDWVDQLANYVARRSVDNPPQGLLLIYLYLYQLLRQDHSEDRFQEARTVVEQQLEYCHKAQHREIYAFLMNYCIRRMNTGDASYRAILFDLYQQQLEQEVLFENGHLSSADFKNLVSLSVQTGQFSWGEQFIEQYKRKLKPESRESAYRYNLAVLRFAQQDFTSTRKILREIDFDDMFYQLGAKTMLLKVYYEIRDFDTLFYFLDSFEAFLRRNQKLPAYQKELYRNLISLVRILSKYRIQIDASYRLIESNRIEALKRRILRKKKIAQTDWLLEKVNQLSLIT